MSNPDENPTRVLLVDDHKSILWGLVKLFESARPRIEVVGTANDYTEALAIARRESPDLILLDIDLKGVNSLDFLPALLQEVQTRVLILTGVSDTDVHDRAMLCGARGVVHKEEPAEVILKAVKKVHRGEVWLDRAATGRVFSKLLQSREAERSDPEAKKIASLTQREREIIAALVEQGRSTNKQVAGLLKMSEFTLRNHLSSIYGKLGLENRLELFMYALKHNLARHSG